ncbi:MAG TPA: hypothetical protein ENF64_01195 [Hadesarchaea archaeon]|nr:hypothetical protein [Hadesarchaea archaeon]
MAEKTFVGIIGVFAFLLLIGTASGAGSQAEVPTWNVGDSWSMGAEDIDLTPILTALMENLAQSMPGTNYDASGHMSCYIVHEVVGEDEQCYIMEVNEGVGINTALSFSSGYGGQSGSGSAEIFMSITINGTTYHAKNNLAVTQMEGTIDMKMDISFSGSGFNTTELGSLSGSASLDLSGDFQVTYDPPLDMFDFPITVGESWLINSTATVTGNVSGTINIPGFGTQSINEPLDTTVSISLTATCLETQNFTLPDGSVTTAYKIVLSGTGMEDTIPFMPASVIYYSPDSGYIVAEELSLGDVMSTMTTGNQDELSMFSLGAAEVGEDQALFTMNPMTKDEAMSGIAGLGSRGTDWLTLGIIVAVILVVIAVAGILVFLVRRR